MNTRIKLLTFDLDDTLWPCKPTIIAAENLLYEWMQHNVPEITELFDLATLIEKRRLFARRKPEVAHDMSEMRIASLRALAEEVGIGDDWVREAFEVFYEARQQVTLYKDVTPVLDELQQNYRLAAVTNGNADIEKTGVSQWFEFAVSAAEAGQMKPHPDFFELVLEKGGVSAEQTLHIGDDQHRDIYGACQAGVRTVWVNRGGQRWEHPECEADVHITSLTELPRVVEALDR